MPKQSAAGGSSRAFRADNPNGTRTYHLILQKLQLLPDISVSKDALLRPMLAVSAADLEDEDGVASDASGASAGTLGKASEPVGTIAKTTAKTAAKTTAKTTAKTAVKATAKTTAKATGTKRKNETPAAQRKKSRTELKASSSRSQKGHAVVEDSDSDAVVIVDADVEMEEN
jgi:hypothetical protein